LIFDIFGNFIFYFWKLNFISNISRQVWSFDNPNKIKTFRIKSMYDVNGHLKI